MSFNDLHSMKNAPGKDKAGDQIKTASLPGEPTVPPTKAPADVAAGLPKTETIGESVVSKS